MFVALNSIKTYVLIRSVWLLPAAAHFPYWKKSISTCMSSQQEARQKQQGLQSLQGRWNTYVQRITQSDLHQGWGSLPGLLSPVTLQVAISILSFLPSPTPTHIYFGTESHVPQVGLELTWGWPFISDPPALHLPTSGMGLPVYTINSGNKTQAFMQVRQILSA